MPSYSSGAILGKTSRAEWLPDSPTGEPCREALRLRLPCVCAGQALDNKLPAKRGQAVVQAGGGVLRSDRHSPSEQDVTGVQPGRHLHETDTGLRVTCLNRPVYRGRAAPTRQKRGVDVDATQT